MTIGNILLPEVYGLKPEVWGRVGPDPRAELQVDPARGPGPTLTQTRGPKN